MTRVLVGLFTCCRFAGELIFFVMVVVGDELRVTTLVTDRCEEIGVAFFLMILAIGLEDVTEIVLVVGEDDDEDVNPKANLPASVN